MSFALLIIGITLVVAAVRNTQGALITLVSGDFQGPGNFLYWIVALLLIGALGYIPKLKPVSDGFLVLIILALVLSKGNPSKNVSGGFFKQLTDALSSTKSTSPVSVTPGSIGGPITNPATWTTLPDGTVLTPTGR